MGADASTSVKWKSWLAKATISDKMKAQRTETLSCHELAMMVAANILRSIDYIQTPDFIVFSHHAIQPFQFNKRLMRYDGCLCSVDDSLICPLCG